MKQIIILTSIVFLFLTNSIYSQNLLLESGFQLQTFDNLCVAGQYHPYAQIDKHYSYWESQYENKAKYRRNKWQIYKYRDCRYKYYGANDDYEYCKCCDFHSPDIEAEIISNYKNYYIAMGEVELIQQNFIPQNELEEGKFYKVKLKIRIPTFLGHNTDYNFLDDDLRLKIMLAKNKIKYKKPGAKYGSDPIGDMCDIYGVGDYHNGYYEYQANGIEVLKEIYVNDYARDIWTEVAFVFQAPSEFLNKYDWFAIDVEGSNEGNPKNFINIDDITIEETELCNTEIDCSPTDGEIHPSIASKIYQNYKNYAVLNLENVYSATNIEILDYLGRLIDVIPDVICENGIQRVVWDGGGAGSLNQATLEWRMLLTNDCGEYNYSEKFNFSNINGDGSFPITDDCIYGIDIPAPCCEAEPNIFIENETLQGAGNISYHAINNITISNTTIKSTAKNVSFKAGNEIVLNDGVEIEEGANVEMTIEPCENKQTEKRDSLYEKEVFNDVFVDDIELSKEELIEQNIIEHNKLLFQIQPNPANNFTNVYIDFLGKKCCSCSNYNIISIKDISGKGYYSEKILGNKVKINVSNFPPGIYFVNITSKGFSETKKLIVQ